MPVHRDTVCFLCGCLCDDLTVETAGERIIRVDGACAAGAATLQQLTIARPPAAACDGASCRHDVAIRTAAGLLAESQAPLIFGLQSAATDDQRAAIELAERLGAVLDTSGSSFTRDYQLALQQRGISTCTLGEVKQRADLVIFWGADPARTHPRLIERLCQTAASEFLPQGRADRTLIVVSAQEIQTEAFVDVTLRIPPGSDADALAAVRQLIRNPDWQPSHDLNLPRQPLQALARQMTASRYGMLFFGPEAASGPGGARTLEGLIRLVTELNAFTRFSARPLMQPGAEQVLSWQTGFPLAVDFQQGFPRYQPGEFSAEELLVRDEVDVCLLIGSGSLAHLSPAVVQALQAIPTIVIDPPFAVCPFVPQVQFTTAFPGVQATGTAYRLDGIALPLRQLCESPYPTTASVLVDIGAEIANRE